MKEILKAKPTGLSGDPPGMEPQVPRLGRGRAGRRTWHLGSQGDPVGGFTAPGLGKA